MGMNEGISIKHGCNTNWDTEFKIYLVPKSIPAGKSQNFVDISWEQKPHTDKVFGICIFFYLERQVYIDITRTKINLW